MEVICSGLNVVDLLVATPNDVAYGQKTECEKIVVQGGAPAGNAASGLAALGHDVGFVGYLGNNTLSHIARAELTRHGVKDVLFLDKEGAAPAIAIVQIDDKGERTVLYSMSGYTPFSPADVDESIFDDCKLLLVDGYDVDINTHLLKLAKERGIYSVLDMEKADDAVMREMVGLCSHAILPLEAAQVLTRETSGEACVLALNKLTTAEVVITDGSNGSYALIDGAVVNQPAFKVDVVDTTGCGDAFHAAYASALLQGKPARERLTYASFFASQVAKHFGGRTFLPSRQFMEAELKASLV